MTHRLNIDLETYSSVDIKKAGAQAYIRSPDFEILLFAYSNRLAVFYKQTSPLIEYYEKAGLLLNIETTDSEEIMAELVAALEK